MTNTYHCYPTQVRVRIPQVLFLTALLLALAPNTASAETFSGTLDSDHLSDEYTVNVPSFGTLLIEVTTGPDLNLYGGVFLFDSDGETSFYGTNQSPGTTVTHTVNRLRPGQYKLVIEKDGRSFYFGDYSVVTSVIATQLGTDEEFNDAMDSALVLDLDTQVTGLLGYRGQQIPDDMDDWYMVTLPAQGDLKLTVSTSGGNDDATGIRYSDGQLNLYGGVFVYDMDGETSFLGINQSPGTTTDYVINALRPGTYFIRLEIDGRLHYYWGSYTLMATALPWSRATDPEPNDDFDSAQWIADETLSATGDLGTRGQGADVDYKDYWIFNHQGGELIVTVRTSGGEDAADSGDGELNLYGSVSIYNSARESLFGTNQSPNTEKTYNLGERPAGEYYLLLEKDGRSFYWGTYAVSITGNTIVPGTDDTASSIDSDSDATGYPDGTDTGDTDNHAGSDTDIIIGPDTTSGTDSGDVVIIETDSSDVATDDTDSGYGVYDTDIPADTGSSDSDTGIGPDSDSSGQTVNNDTEVDSDTDTENPDDIADTTDQADCSCKVGAPLGGDEPKTLFGLLLLTMFALIRRRFR
ncbi:MAG: hypothetical protein JXX14_08760 [Deltaproteobacteria bacterium]|nr:hypothetical protein [Deltaproteobacteria bacterium]